MSTTSDDRPTFGSLFAGIGGMDLGLERAGWRGRWQVEYEPFCQRVLARHWPDVHRVGDVHDAHGRDFCPSSVADTERDDGHCPNCLEPVDLIAGGFPCQPWSNAGQRKGLADDRWLWPEFERCIRELRPRYVLVENVPGLLVGGGVDAVLGGLASLGYDTEWESIPASAVGAPHLRYRVWIIAYRQADAPRPDADGFGPHRATVDELRGAELRDEQVGKPGSVGWAMAHASGDSRGFGNGDGPTDVPDADLLGREGERVGGLLDGLGPTFGDDPDGRDRALADAASVGPSGPGEHGEPVYPATGRDGQADQSGDGGWWLTEPDVGRVAHGVPARVDRLRALGNAVVPQVVEFIGRRILEAEGLT